MAERNYDKLAEQYRKEAQDPYAGKTPSKESMQEAADEATRRKEERAPTTKTTMKKKGGCVKMAKGGYVRAADGCATKGKTKGRMI